MDPSGVGVKNGQFLGLECSVQESDIVVLCAPWDVTTSYRPGTHRGPQAVIDASTQIDLTHPALKRAWELKIATLPSSSEDLRLNHKLRTSAERVIACWEQGGDPNNDPALKDILELINAEGAKYHEGLRGKVRELRQSGKRVITLGGDHSCAWGPIRAMCDTEKQPFSVLHIDAHADLRVAYEGFEHSHASIMHHVKEWEQVESLTQVGIRDYSRDEAKEIEDNHKIRCFFDAQLKAKAFEGISWHQQCEAILETLGPRVYLSFDIDGLDARYCPNTGTPVPGGLEFDQATYLIERVVKSGRSLIGADLLEVAPGAEANEWDANVGARMLWSIAGWLAASR